jgi:two-component system response regulator NreC
MSFLLRALKSGAKGFLLTSSGSQEIIRALLSLRGGYEYFGPCLTQYLVRESLLAGPGYSPRSANENAHQKEPTAAGPDNDKPIAGGPAGEVPINNGPAVSVIPDKICKNLNMPSLERLSQREIEIMSLWGEGFSNPDISDKLCISIRTVESHKNHIMQKLNLKTNVDLIKFGIKNNIIQLD